MDLCVDDIDTVANFKPWPNDYSPPSMHFSNLQKKSDFGFPKDWTPIELTGGPTQLYILKQTIKENSVIIIIVSVLLLALLTVIMIIQYKRIAFLRNMPERKSLFDEEAKPAETKTIASLFPLIQPHQEHIIKLKNYIEENIDADISIDQLAAKLHTSTRQLQRIFKEELNLTPKQFITIIKLEKASLLLTNTNKSISEIAFATGFSDPAYFTNVFKRYFGLPPSSFGKK
ncbi:MAG: helix-turn-helix transcriptional regulator [Chitinophagaceae bacterium]|nr:helix-turn-helix transcriptional regulator [Chitinophagaceae bacterium]